MSWTSTGNIRGPQGPQGPAGPAGASGPAGATGAAGPQGSVGAVGAQGPAGSTGPAGATGPAGPTGPTGPQGAAGTGINLKGNVATQAQLPSSGQLDGDAYVVATVPPDRTNVLFVWDTETTQWVDAGSISGPAGPAGPAGSAGPTGPAGGTGPAGATGATGPQGIQGPIGPTGVAGPAGTRGTGWFVGSGPPPTNIPGSIVGDMYLDQATGDVYLLGSGPTGIPVGNLPAIGAAFQGGFYGGLISQSANGVATHALVIAPKATGHVLRACKTTNTATAGTSSTFDGYANSEAAKDAAHPANQWARALSIGGYSDWYIPAQFELEILFRRFKPDNSEGNTPGFGANAYAVPPTTANYSGSVPPATAVTAFQAGNAEAFEAINYGSSTQDGATTHVIQDWFYGPPEPNSKTFQQQVRAIRKVAVLP
ncbi:collagen-like protein [Synechococcus sp. 1G10]|uniref:collagen-like protein n=1 Tax=Synechococcus sp. 1G10 TaxID=2025605 RepID=UPI00117E3A83|nr:collagen-like protein [Synechococcus sp. 1G10]